MHVMDKFMAVAEKHKLVVVEDAAQRLLTNFQSKPLGSIGYLVCLSFHEI